MDNNDYNERVDENFSYKHAKSSWMSAAEQFSLVEAFAQVGEAEGSLDSALQGSNYQDYVDSLGDPELRTNNFLACVPLLYAILRGSELYIKACEYVGYPKRVPTHPQKLPELLEIYASAPYEKDPEVARLIEKYTQSELMPKLPSRFLKASNKTIDDLLRARLLLDDKILYRVLSEYEPMVYSEEEGRQFFAELRRDIKPAIASCEAFHRDIDENGVPGPLILACVVA